MEKENLVKKTSNQKKKQDNSSATAYNQFSNSVRINTDYSNQKEISKSNKSDKNYFEMLKPRYSDNIF